MIATEHALIARRRVSAVRATLAARLARVRYMVARAANRPAGGA
jgi:hypothetical protein